MNVVATAYVIVPLTSLISSDIPYRQSWISIRYAFFIHTHTHIMVILFTMFPAHFQYTLATKKPLRHYASIRTKSSIASS